MKLIKHTVAYLQHLFFLWKNKKIKENTAYFTGIYALFIINN